jgi:glycosyltransferase involved in cell wall biosynthesis
MYTYPVSINARFLTQPITGVQRYSYEIINALDDILEPGQAIAYFPPGRKKNVSWKNIQLEATGWFTGNLWEQIDLPRVSRGTLLFSPANIGPFLKLHQVVTIHDASVFAHPDAYTWSFRLKYKNIYRRMAKVADHFITTSEFSKHELQHWLELAPERISVIYEGREHLERIAADESVISRLSLGEKPFFIVVGSISPHKNLEVVYAANKLLDRDKYEIILIGGDFAGVFQSSKIELAPNIKKVGYLLDDELKALYCSAMGLIFPSLYEGFGLPLVEAMSCSCPVICSDIPSSREVCGDAALYFDAERPADLADQIDMIINDFALAVGLKERGLLRSRNFTWIKTALETKQILDNYR